MTFPRKYKQLLEIEKKDIAKPYYAWITYVVCATNKKSCGWGGWMLDSVFQKYSRYTLPTLSEQTCPCCGNPLFRTGVSYKFILSKIQKSILVSGRNYTTVPMKYTNK